MNRFAVQFWVGTLVVASGLIAGILILLLGNKPAMFQPTYIVNIDFTDAPGVMENTPIRRSGILIGRVKSVKLLQSGMVHVVAGIHKDKTIPVNSKCQVRSNALLGDAEIAFYIPPGELASQQSFEPEATIRGSKSVDPMAAMTNLQDDMSQAIHSVSSASEQLGVTLGKINTVLDKNEQHIDSIVTQTDQTLKLIQDTAKFTNELMADPKFRQDLKAEFEKMPDTLRSARQSITQIQTTLQNMDHTMSLVDDNLVNIRNFTEPLGDNGKQIANNIDESVRRLNNLMIEMETFGKTINNREGTLGRLTQDDELYERLNRTVRNIEEISYRLKPIVNDVRIVSDKMARHPGSILRDAVLPGPGTKGLPPSQWDPAQCGANPSSYRR